VISRRALLTGGAAAGLGLWGLDAFTRAHDAGAALWFTYGGKNRTTLERLVRRFNDRASSTPLRAVFQGDYYEGLAKLRTALAAGAAPALSHVIGEVVPYLAEVGVLETLDGYPGARELGIVKALGQSGSWDTGGARPLVALPFNRSTPIAYFNREHFAAARLRPPGTWDELRQTARELTLREGREVRRYGFGCPISWWFWVALTAQAGGSLVEPSRRVSLGDEAGVDALRFWQTLVHTDGTMRPPPGRDYNAWEATNQDFLAGRVSMIWTSTAFLRYLEENARFPVGAAPLPGHVRRAVPTGGTFWIVPKQAALPDKQVAWDFLRFMHEPQQVIDWATATGYLPVTEPAVSQLERSGYYAAHPNDRVAWDQLEVAFSWPWSRDLFRVQREIVDPLLERAVLMNADAAALLAEARRTANAKAGAAGAEEPTR
jgi:sn-glycerol 3-phosphate transport system substrate-binding protein